MEKTVFHSCTAPISTSFFLGVTNSIGVKYLDVKRNNISFKLDWFNEKEKIKTFIAEKAAIFFNWEFFRQSMWGSRTEMQFIKKTWQTFGFRC